MTQTKLLTQEEVAKILRCSVPKIRALRRRGQIAFMPGRPVLFAESEVEAYIARETTPCKPAPSDHGVAKASEDGIDHSAVHRRVARAFLRRQTNLARKNGHA